MNGDSLNRLRAAVAGTPVDLPEGTETVTVSMNDLVALLVEAGANIEAVRQLSGAVQLAESFLSRVAKVVEADLPLYRSIVDHVQSAMSATGVPIVVDDPLPV